MAAIQRSLALQKKALKLMPGPSSNLGGVWNGQEARFVVKGKGSRFWDVDGNEYIDYAIGIGPGILGFCHDEHNRALKEQIDRLTYMAGWCQVPQEVELAEKIVEHVPCAEKVRFCVTGTEAVQLAIRLARAYTRRRYFVRFEGHYVGWMDNVLGGLVDDNARDKPYAVDTPGDPSRTDGRDPDAFMESFKLPWNDIDVLEKVVRKYGEEIALIHMEPILCNAGCCMPHPGYLERVRQLCDQYGIVLSFDEIITGFRVALNGAQGLFGVKPDIATFGKALGGGVPVSMIAGKKEILDLLLQQKVIGAGTFNGYPLGIAASLATIKILERDNGVFYKNVERIQNRLTLGLKDVAKKHGIPMLLQGPTGVFIYEFINKDVAHSSRDLKEADAAMQKKFRALMLEEGIFFFMRGRWFVSGAITDTDVAQTLEAAERVMRKL